MSEQNAVSSHVILVYMLHSVLPYPSLQLLHSTANVSEQIMLTGFWGCPRVRLGREGRDSVCAEEDYRVVKVG